MSIASKYNRTTFDVDTNGYTFTKLSTLYNAQSKDGYIIDGVYCHTSPFGESAIFVVSDEKWLVNLPQHFIPTVKKLLEDTEAVEAIRNRKLGFTVYEYEARGQKCYSVRLFDK